jgi:tRNA-dihydrouridine synthase A
MNLNNDSVLPVSVAPMMDWTDRHERFFLRQISKRVQLYTEMITTNAILKGDRKRLLNFDGEEHPVILQIGGVNTEELSECARIGADFGFDGINLNVGCPSDRVQQGEFGACLMATPELVAKAVDAMRSAVDLPITVKHRIAIDDQEEWPCMKEFVKTVSNAGCEHFIVHARKAFLKGLSAKENREIPPLRYDLVYKLKQEFPFLTISINGGINSLDLIESQLAFVDGVMIGREAYQNPYFLADVDSRFFGDLAVKPTRQDILERFYPYIGDAVSGGVPLKSITRHILGLFNGQKGARAWRRFLSENSPRFEGSAGDAINLIKHASLFITQ